MAKLDPFLALLLAAFLPASSAVGANSIPLTIQERTGAPRTNEFAIFGVPLARDWAVRSVSELRLRNAQAQSLPAQLEILSRWGAPATDTNAPAKWVLVACPTTLGPYASNMVWLEHGGTTASPPVQIAVSATGPDRIFVDTGAAVFKLNCNSFNLFEQVTISGTPVLQTLPASRALRFLDINGTSVVQAATNRPARLSRLEVERGGPLYTVLKMTGSVPDNQQRAVLDYTVRYHFYAGKAEARVDLTVENNFPVLEGESGQPVNVHEQGSTNSVYLGGLQLALQLAANSAPVGVQMENDVNVLAPVNTLRLYQDSSGHSNWNVYVGLVGWETNVACAPRLQSYCTMGGYTITGMGTDLTGAQALGWATVYRVGPNQPWMQVAMRDFWQNFPKTIEVQTNGMLLVDLFPNGTTFRHNLRVGEEKTHTMLFRFGLGAPTHQASEQCAVAFNSPLWGQVPPPWIIQTKALGEVPAQNVDQWPLYERYVRIAFEPNPDFDPAIHDPNFGNTTLRQVIERYNFYGWQDYGDVPLDYEAFGPNQAGQMNLKYWYVYGLFIQYCRSSDLHWLDLARPAAWHLADIDYLHIPDEGPQHWVHGAYFGHSNHDEPGNINPNRNSNSPSVDLFFGVPDLLLAYYLTGETRFSDVALEGLEAMLNESQFSNFSNPVFYRERANLIFAYLEGYRHTGDLRWLDALRAIVRATADLSNKGWLADPRTYRPAEEWQWLSSFQFSQVLWTLGRYLDFCEEFQLTDNLGVTNALVAYADFALRHFMHEYRPDRAAAWNAFYFYDTPDQPYLEINNWALVMADALAYAYKFSGRTNYMTAAAKFYATGVIDPVWEDDPPVFLATKDLVNAMNWGLVYMKLSQQPEIPPVIPTLKLYLQSSSRIQTVLRWDDLGPYYRYAVEGSDNLPSVSWSVLSGGQLITSNSWTDTHPGAAKRFWRIRAERHTNAP